jgi:hypothetical protein
MPSFEILTYVFFGITNVLRKFEDTKGVIKIRKSKKDRQHNGKKTHTENNRSSNTNPTENWDALR